MLSTAPFRHLGRLVVASEVLPGPYRAITPGNFVPGPNCVLPTGGWARSFGPLRVTDFMQRFPVGYVARSAHAGMAGRLQADCAGFAARAAAVPVPCG